MTAFYGTPTGYKAYADARGWSYVGIDDATITQGLVRSSVYIDGAYRGSFEGRKTGLRAQEREWPRIAGFDIEGFPIIPTEVPVEIENATYEGTKRELASPGSLAPDIEPGGGQLQREKIGPLEFEYHRDGSLVATFRAIDQALGSLLIVRSSYSGAASRG